MQNIKFIFWVVLGLQLLACAHTPDLPYHAIVTTDARLLRSAHYFSTVQAALDAAPAQPANAHRIFISAGDYYEKIIISKPNIHLIGAGMENTRLYFDAYAGQVSEPGKTWGTRASATMIVRAADVQIHQLTIENTFDFMANDARDNDDAQKIQHSQAVALTLDHGSDRTLVRQAKLLGYQDTLFADVGRAWFDKTIIAGNVDFIFGAGNALFTESTIVTRNRGRHHIPHAYVTAPSTQIANEFGLTFIGCRLTREDGVPDNSTPLGRPWQPTTTFADGRYADPRAIGKTVFIDTAMDAHITHAGWHSMSGTTRDGGKKPFMPEHARFFEYRSHGDGAHQHPARRQLTDAEAKQYSWSNMMGDWLQPH